MKCNPVVATIAIDLAKSVLQLLAVDAHGKVLESHRLSRAAFIAFWHNRAPVRVVMEACGSAHHFGRWLTALGHQVTLIPAQYVRPYVRRSKTDAADCLAMIEAARAIDLKPVPIKTELQQVIQLLHRARQQWQETRTARINLARGLLREFGIVVPEGAARGQQAMRAALGHEALDRRMRDLIASLLEEIRALEQRVVETDRALASTAQDDPVIAQLESLPGIGWVTATAVRASIGDIHRFRDGRVLSSWLGFTPKEHSSGSTRQLGRMSKCGDVYCRTLMIQGARAVLAAAKRAQAAGKPLDRLRTWALVLAERRGFNKAAVGLANKLVRILWATWRHARSFDGDYANRFDQEAAMSNA
jgi:transposase